MIICEIAISTQNDKKIRFDSTNIDLSQLNQKIKINKKNHVFFEIFETTHTMKKTSKMSIVY